MNNHEIRFKCDKDMKDILDRLNQEVAPEIKRTYFYNLVTLQGLKKIMLDQTSKNPEQIKLLLLKNKP